MTRSTQPADRRRAVGLISMAAGLLSLAACGEDAPPPIPTLLPISDFVLTDQDGEAFDAQSLHGKVWVADLIFTRCPEICPVMSTQMANLHRRVRDPGVRFVSLTVDPEVDTPEVLRSYAERYRADTERWVFLTGDPDDVRRVIHRSFRLPIGERMNREDGSYDILHGGRFILVDPLMNMRGLYETDREGLEALERDIARLLEGG